jgi:type IV pilus assembly protein PilV
MAARSDVQTEMTLSTFREMPGQISRAGFTLIEILVALLVVSVGMLGVAGLFVHSIQAGRTAHFSVQAVTLAADVADRIRANPRAGAAYAGAGIDSGCVTGTAKCDAEQMAQHDIFLWTTQVENLLPGGEIHVQYDGGTLPAEYTITVGWNEPGQDRRYVITIPVIEM